MLKPYYFTFGSSEQFPYQNGYLIIYAHDHHNAFQIFRTQYPDREPGCLNCSDYYDGKAWEMTKAYYKDREPFEVLYACNSLVKSVKGYDDLWVFVPECSEILHIYEGTGDNLLAEDIENGFVDYICYDQYAVESEMPESDGGQLMSKEMIKTKYTCLADAIPDVLDLAYDHAGMETVILKVGE